ncbi:uncharacterized protein LOC133908822 [Phragmites australis]|uniref:uncharacterized protein LOC133908822 n=1 Tax=Phragmites australis TaxID=29695 RepID=UPI002D79659F|nr:uncharacterized protein LOC133908822 [Phragmites australis]
MDFPKRERALSQGSPRRSPRATRPGGGATEADENASPRRLVLDGAASPQRKKVLGERNSGVDGGGGMEAAASPPAPQPKPAPSPPSLTGRGAGAYDPKTNYTTPRPDFLRYDPERRREILLRLARAVDDDDDRSSATSGAAASETASSLVSSARGSDSEAELDDGDEEEEVVVPARRGVWSRRLFLLLVAVACSLCYIYCMKPTPFPVHSEDGLDFVGPIGSMYDAGDHEVDSLRLLGPIYMMGPEDVLEETTSQIVHGDSEDVVHLYDQRASPRNLMAIAMMGLADICPSVPLGDLTCQIWDESIENLDDLKQDSELAEQKATVIMGFFENADRSSKVGCLGGNISRDPIGSTSTHTTDMEEGSSGLVHQEKGEDYSNQFVPQLVSMGKAMESVSDKLDDRNGFESEELNLDIEQWQHENTAEAARAICAMVKFLWSAMEPHLLQILACLSVAGFVAAMFKYFQRSQKIAAPAPQHMPSKLLDEVPVLVPHQVAQLPVFPSPQAALLPVYSSQQSVQLRVPKQDLFVNLKDPVQLPLPKTEPFVNLEFPVIDHTNRDQKLQQGDAENMKTSHGNSLDHIDSSKPPVVELLGEFTFADSSRGRSIKNLNQHAGDAAVQEPSKSLGKDVDKMQKNSSIVQSPSVRRASKEENAVKGEKMDATPTPVRRSS